MITSVVGREAQQADSEEKYRYDYMKYKHQIIHNYQTKANWIQNKLLLITQMILERRHITKGKYGLV